MLSLLRLRWVYVYVLLIPLVNWSFAHTPIIPLPTGGDWTPFAVVTGLVLVFRDFAQREVGHFIFIPLFLGVAVSYAMAPAAIATSSALAFLVSEFVDWCVYTFSKKALHQRILLSSIIAAPFDSAVFLIGANMVVEGIFHWTTLLTSIFSKWLGAYIICVFLKRRLDQTKIKSV